MDIQKLIRPNIQTLKPYASARDEFKGEARIYLDANENPNPSGWNRYPDPLQQELKRIISYIKGVAFQNIFVGNGSDEPIDLLIRAFCEPGHDQIIIPQPTYGMYQVSAGINNVEVVECSLTPDFDLDVNAILSKVSNKSKILFLCSPNNPTGNVLSRSTMEQLISQFPGIVVIDEAYQDFSGQESFNQQLDQFPNLVVLQTLSKAWGMASLRIGLAFASELIVGTLNKIKPPYNISGIAQREAIQRLKNRSTMEAEVTEIIRQREILARELENLTSVEKVYPSHANFVLVRMKNAHVVYRQLMEKGIIVRDRSRVLLCENCLRITVGTSDENKELIRALQS